MIEDGQDDTSEQIKKICTIIEERDKILLETDVKIKYYTDATETIEHEIKALEKARKRIAEEEKDFDQQSEQLEFIKKRVKDSQEIATQSLKHYHTLEKMIAKELDIKKQETKQVDEEFRTIYNEAKTILSENPLCKDLEKARVEFLKVDIKRRDLEVKIRNKKRIIAQRTEIQKKIYYNFFVQMAEDYLTERKMVELQELKMQELEAIKKLYVLQENVKMRQKYPPRDKVKNMTNIIFGNSQECHTEKPASKLESSQPKKVSQSLSEKLTNIFQQDEPKQVQIPQKIQIIEDQIVVPAFVAPQFAASEKRKFRTVDLSKKWQKMIKLNNSKENIFSSQQSDVVDSAQLSQQSLLSQKSRENEACNELVMLEPSLHNNLIESSMQSLTPASSQESQKIQLTQNTEKVPVQYKIVDSLNTNEELSFITDKPQPCLSTNVEQSTPTNDVIKPRSILTVSESKYAGSNAKPELIPKTPFGESGKSVRFNLKTNNQPKGNKGMFSSSLFGNPFESFFIQPSENMEQDHTINKSLDVSLMDQTGEHSRIALEEFETGLNQSTLRSPEYSYGMDSDAEHALKTPEMPSFGGGGGTGFFSFGSKSMFPFQ